MEPTQTQPTQQQAQQPVLTKKQLQEQRREEKLQRKEHAATQARNKKVLLLGLLILATVGMVWAIAASQKSTIVQDKSPDPSRGPQTAKVVIKEYADFQCPGCAATYPVLDDILEEYGDQVRFVFNDYPLPQHNHAVDAAIAAECAFAQDTFFPMHDKLFDTQDAWEAQGTQQARDTFRQYAQDLGLDMDAFNACVSAGSTSDRINEDIAEGNAAKVNSTPTFFVNGERIVNTPFSTNLRNAIDAALAATQ